MYVVKLSKMDVRNEEQRSSSQDNFNEEMKSARVKNRRELENTFKHICWEFIPLRQRGFTKMMKIRRVDKVQNEEF